MDLNNLYFFAQVVDCGGFSAAADRTGLQTSKLSRRVTDLEKELDVRLLNRTTRRISLTEAGKTFYDHCIAMIAEAQAGRDAISQVIATPRGIVRMSCPPGLLHSGLAAVIGDFLAQHADVQVQVEATNRRVDVIEEGIDIAIRIRIPPLEDSTLAMRQLCPSRFHLVASPALLKRISTPKEIEAVAELPTVGMAVAGKHIWRFLHKDGRKAEVRYTPRLITDEFQTLRLAALAGVGIAFLPDLLIADDLASGKLVKVLPDWSVPEHVVHAVFASRRGMVPAVRELLDYLSERLGTR